MSDFFEKEFPVRNYEVDWNGRVSAVTLLNYLQDAAAGHAALLGVAVSDLLARGLIWVISRIHLRVGRYVQDGEIVRVRTWPSTRNGLFSCREFEAYGREGVTVALATSSWAALDLKTRRPVRLSDRLPPYPLQPRRAIPDEFGTLPQPERVDAELCFQVRREELDVNRHVNNAVYAEWALETMPGEIAEGFRPEEIEIGFRAEALYGDTVVSRCQQVESGASPSFIHQLWCERDGRELARLRTRWRKN